MKRLLLVFTLLTGCATSSATQRPACVDTVVDATVREAAARALAILTSDTSKENIVNNLEAIERDVGPDAFKCAMEYLRGRL